MKFLKALLLLIFLSPNFALADDYRDLPEGAEEVPTGKATTLEKGDKAPFPGLLLDDVAVAKILADKESAKEEKELALEEQQEKHEAEVDFLNKEHQVEIDALEEQKKILEEARRKEVDYLNDIIKQKEEDEDDWVWWLVGGIGIGALVATGVAVPIALAL